jgi:hypothetical protein
MPWDEIFVLHEVNRLLSKILGKNCPYSFEFVFHLLWVTIGMVEYPFLNDALIVLNWSQISIYISIIRLLY